MIDGLKTRVLDRFVGGRNTDFNLARMSAEDVLLAKNVVFLGDGVARKRPGYTLVATPFTGKVARIHDYQRDIDQKQFVFVTGAGKIATMNADGSGITTLATTEDATAIFDFVKNLFAAYASNGKASYRFVDNAGTLTKYNWGIAAPGVAPTITTGAGSLTLKYGRQYVFCYVSKVTDAAGTTRVHVGAPSPLSAHTGPLTDKVVTLGSLTASTDPQVTHIWVFATMDTPLNTTSAFYFAAEISNGTTSWGDTLADSALDTTRLAPWDNKPAPQAEILLEYQSRIVALKIKNKPNLVQFSGFEEIDLGIPQEAWPTDLSFQVPGGKQELSGAAVFNDLLMLGTRDYWWAVSGYNAETFRKRDKIIQPGPAGKRAVVATPTHLVWLGKDKKLWAWDGVSTPVEASFKLRKQLAGTFSMEDLSDAQLGNAEVRWFAWGRYNFIVVAASTTQQQQGTAFEGAFDWIQLWSADAIGMPREDGTVQGLAESDMLPGDLLSATGIVEVGAAGARYLFLGDFSAGKVYRWPDGFTDNGAVFQSVLGTVWLQPDGADIVHRLYWADISTDRSDASSSFQVFAVAADGPNMAKQPAQLPVGPLVSGYGTDPTVARANMQVDGASIGRWARILVRFPDDPAPAGLLRLAITSKPIYAVSP